MSAILPNLVEEGERLLALGHAQDATFALLGGVAVRLRAPEVPPALDREYKDLDFAVPKGTSGTAGRILADAGYEPHVVFNAMNSKERMLFHDNEHGRQVDVFVGSFRMCHAISFERLRPGAQTVPLAELLLTKLQIIELNEKDIRDTVLLLHGHEVADHDDGDAVNGARIAELCAADWGLWRTITANLEKAATHVDNYALSDDEQSRVRGRLEQLLERIEAQPKGRAWRLRDKVGDKKRWYDLPEEVEQ